MSLELGCVSILAVIILAVVALCTWLVPSRTIAPPRPSSVVVTENDDQIVLDNMILNTVNMVKQPLNPLAVSHPAPPKRQVYPMGSPTRSSPIDFDDTSLLLASELASMDKYDVVDIKKPDEVQWCVQPAVPTYNVEAPVVCAPTPAYCAPVVEETKYHSPPSYDYGSHNSCSGYSSSSSSDSSSSSSSSSSSGD